MANSEWKVGSSGGFRPASNCHSPFAAHHSLLRSHRPDFDHVGHKVPQQVLDAVLQRRGR
jgi:hypothetical protein